MSSTLLNGLVAYWNFDESSGNVLDSVGSSDGTVHGTPTRNGAGIKVGYTFNGTTDYLMIRDLISSKAFKINM